MATASVVLFCPPMQIRKVDGTHRRTAAEPMRATITLPDRIITIPSVVIPETVVVKQRLLYWLVDACVGKGATALASLTTNLPPEPTIWSWSDFTMVAQPIQAPTLLVLDDGSQWSGLVTYPHCRISGLLSSVQVAESVVATGVLNLISE